MIRKDMKGSWKRSALARAAAVMMSAAVAAGSFAMYTPAAEEETESVTEQAADEDLTEAETEDTAQEEDKEDTQDFGDIVLSTDYAGISAKPGATVKFTLYLTNASDTQTDLTLSAQDLPDGWDGYFRGSDSDVSSVHVYPQQTKEDSPTLSYSVTVPEDASEGTYNLVLKASSEDASASLALTVDVTKEESGTSSFTAEYPEQQGASGTSFSFSTTIVNNSTSSQSYALSANAPTGWTVTFTPSGQSSQVASLPVDAGSSQGLTVAITPPDQVEKGDYTINLTAASADETLNLDLNVTITGTYAVTLSTPTGNLSASAYAGEDAKVTMTVTNTGNVDLENLQLAGAGSTDWTISFDESTIDVLEAGASKEVTATITPAENAIIGDYVTAMTVSNDQVNAEADLRISVKNHTTWGYVAVVIIVVLIVGLVAIIRKYGRR